jgi:hypothetical protein
MSSLLEAVLFSRLGLVYILIGTRDRQEVAISQRITFPSRQSHLLLIASSGSSGTATTLVVKSNLARQKVIS